MLKSLKILEREILGGRNLEGLSEEELINLLKVRNDDEPTGEVFNISKEEHKKHVQAIKSWSRDNKSNDVVAR